MILKQTTKRKKKNSSSEHNLQTAICQYLVMRKWLVIRINSSSVTTENRFLRSYIIANNKKSSGLADILIMKNGKAIFIEVKSGKGKQSESQVEFQKLCEQYEIEYYIINSIESLIELEKQLN